MLQQLQLIQCVSYFFILQILKLSNYQLFKLIFEDRLSEIFKNNMDSTLVVHSCGGVVAHSEPRAYLRLLSKEYILLPFFLCVIDHWVLFLLSKEFIPADPRFLTKEFATVLNHEIFGRLRTQLFYSRQGEARFNHI